MVHTDIKVRENKILIYIDDDTCLNLISFVFKEDTFSYSLISENYNEQSYMKKKNTIEIEPDYIVKQHDVLLSVFGWKN